MTWWHLRVSSYTARGWSALCLQLSYASSRPGFLSHHAVPLLCCSIYTLQCAGTQMPWPMKPARMTSLADAHRRLQDRDLLDDDRLLLFELLVLCGAGARSAASQQMQASPADIRKRWPRSWCCTSGGAHLRVAQMCCCGRTLVCVEVAQVLEQLVLVARQDVYDGVGLVGVGHKHLRCRAAVTTALLCHAQAGAKGPALSGRRPNACRYIRSTAWAAHALAP